MIALITPTGARADQFNFCAKWMQRQNYPGEITWIIIDDCHPRTTDAVNENFKDDWTIIKIYPIPLWSGQNTQARNLSIGTKTLTANYKKEEIEAIFIIEDDDYYKSNYLERMMFHLSGFQATGEKNTVYYNVAFRTYFIHPNTGHSSLFQTAFTIETLPIFEKCYNQRFIDMSFWPKLTNVNQGIPGRRGIGSGHTRLRNMPNDIDWNYLKSLIGEEDAGLYEGYYRDSRIAQHDILTKKRL